MNDGAIPWDGLVTGGVLLAGGAAIWRIGWLSARDRLRRNSWAGIRTATTMGSEEAWLAAQRAGAKWTSAAGVVALLGGAGTVTGSLLGPSEPFLVGAVGVAMLAVLPLALVGVLRGVGAARRGGG